MSATNQHFGIHRGDLILHLDPERDGFEVYRVGYTFTAGLHGNGVGYLCPVCQGPVALGDRGRSFYTRKVGTQWAERVEHVVHESCWLRARAVQGA